MADIAAGDVTYTLRAGSERRSGGTRPLRTARYRVQFGNATLTYEQDTGIPLTKASLGCPTEISAIRIVGGAPAAAAGNYLWRWNGNTTSPALDGFELNAAVSGDPETLVSGLTEIADDTAIVAQDLEIEVTGF